MGNAVVVAPSAAHPLAATDFYTVLDTSDVPAGVVNIVTGETDALAKTLAEHDGVDAMWHAGSAEGAKAVEAASAGKLKATWTLGGRGGLARGPGARVSAARDAGEEHLDAVWGVRPIRRWRGVGSY